MKKLTVACCLIFWLGACSMNRLVSPAIQRFSVGFETAFAQQSDPALARDGGPSFLIMLDAMIQNDPSNPNLYLTASKSYGAYASAFVLDEEKERAHLLFDRARNYAFESMKRFGYYSCENITDLDAWDKFLTRAHKTQVPVIYQTASAWSGWIVSHPDSMRVMADLTIVLHMMETVLKMDPSYQNGAVHLFFGMYEAARPTAIGGNLEKSKEHFDLAISMAGQEALMPRLLCAKYYARKAFNEILFDELIQSILDAPPPQDPNLNLMNAIAKQQAASLKASRDELF